MTSDTCKLLIRGNNAQVQSSWNVRESTSLVLWPLPALSKSRKSLPNRLDPARGRSEWRRHFVQFKTGKGGYDAKSLDSAGCHIYGCGRLCPTPRADDGRRNSITRFNADCYAPSSYISRSECSD